MVMAIWLNALVYQDTGSPGSLPGSSIPQQDQHEECSMEEHIPQIDGVYDSEPSLTDGGAVEVVFSITPPPSCTAPDLLSQLQVSPAIADHDPINC